MYRRLARQLHHLAHSESVARQTERLLVQQPVQRDQDFRHSSQPALGMAIDQGRLSGRELRLDDPAEVVGDHPAVGHARVEEKTLADGMDGELQDLGEAIAFPGEERKVVVAELEVRREEVAKPFQGVVEPGIPAPVRCGEARRLEPGVAQDAIGAFEVAVVGFGVAVDIVKMAVRLRVMTPQVDRELRDRRGRRGCSRNACSSRPAGSGAARSGGNLRRTGSSRSTRKLNTERKGYG